jgi:acyl-CoA dehydrogenase
VRSRIFTAFWYCSYLLKYGTEDQKQKYHHKWPKGNDYHRDDRAELWKWFESASTTAEDKGDHYVVNGQKHLSLTTCVIWP